MNVPKPLLEELAVLLGQLRDDDSRNDVGGAYLGEEFLGEVFFLSYAIEKTLKNNELVVRRRAGAGRDLWWIGRGDGKRFTCYTDSEVPGGYCFGSRAKAERRAAELQAALDAQEAAAWPGRRQKKRPLP